jgi:hypothetical protein
MACTDIAHDRSAILSHELRTPLSTILGSAELLTDGSLGPLSIQARDIVGGIQRAGGRLVAVVDGLLLLERLERSPLEGDSEIDLARTMRDAAALSPSPVAIAPSGIDAVRVVGDAAVVHDFAGCAVALLAGSSDCLRRPVVGFEEDDGSLIMRLVVAPGSGETGSGEDLLARLARRLMILHDGETRCDEHGGIAMLWPRHRVRAVEYR